MTTRDFGMRFFGRHHFDKDARKKFQDEWSKMTDSEKLEFMNDKVESMDKDHFSVEAIDARCLEWIKMTPEQKQSFIEERKNMFNNRMNGMCGFFRHMH